MYIFYFDPLLFILLGIKSINVSEEKYNNNKKLDNFKIHSINKTFFYLHISYYKIFKYLFYIHSTNKYIKMILYYFI